MKITSWLRIVLLFCVLIIDPVVNKAQPRLFPILENGKWGLMDDSGRVVIPAKYSAAIPRDGDMVEIGLASGKGLIDRDSREILPPEFAAVHIQRDSLVWYRKGAQWGLLHVPSGNSLPPLYTLPNYTYGSYMEMEIAGECPGPDCGKSFYSLISEDAKVVIPPQKARISGFYDNGGFARLNSPDKRGGYWELATGRHIPPIYYQIYPLNENRFAAALEKGNLLQLLDMDGNPLLDLGFEKLDPHGRGWISFEDSIGKGLIDRNNVVLRDSNWDEVEIMGDGTLAVLREGFWGLIASDGSTILAPQFSAIKDLGGDRLRLCRTDSSNRKMYGLIRIDGSQILGIRFQEIQAMQGGPGFAIKSENGWTWVNENGTPSEISGATAIDDFSYGLARVYEDSLIGLFDTSGVILVPAVYTKIVIEEDQVRAYIGEKERFFFFDNDGKLLTGKRFILKRGNEDYQSSNRGGIQIISTVGWFFSPRAGKYGLKDPNTDSLIIRPSYHRVRLIGNTGLSLVEYDLENEVRYGLVDHSRLRKVIDPTLRELSEEDYLQGNVARVTLINGRRTLMSRTGKIMSSNRLRYVGRFSERKARIMLDGKLRWERREDPGSLETRTIQENGRRVTENLYAYNGKWGVMNGNGKWICEPEYDYISDFQNGVSIAIKDGKWGALDSTMEALVPFEWDYLAWMGNSAGAPLIAGRAEGGTGYVSLSGEAITGPNNNGFGFMDGSTFSEGLAAVRIDGLWGYIDKKGRVVIDPVWSQAGDFHEGWARVRLGRYQQFIDRNGTVRETEKVVQAGDYHDGLVWASEGRRYGYLDETGQWAIAPQFYEAGDFQHGLAVVRDKSGRGMIDRNGNEVVKTRYQKIFPFENGMALILHKGKYGCIDSLGAVVVPPRYDKMAAFSEGLAMVKQGNWMGFIDMKGEVVIKGKYRDLENFSGGLAAAKVKDRWGYLNRAGEMVIPPQYIIARDFGGGPAAALASDSWHLLDTNGQDIVRPLDRGMRIDAFREGMAVARSENGLFYVDSLGNQHNRFRGQFLEGLIPFQNGIAQVRIDGSWRLVDRSMQPVISLNFKYPFTFNEGMGRVEFGMKYGMYSPTGEELLPVKYDHLIRMGGIIQVGEGASLSYIRMDGTWVRR